MFCAPGLLHQGNERFYDVWLTPGDLDRIPASLATHTLMHLHKASLAEVGSRSNRCATLLRRMDSQRLFPRGDYIEWLLNRYCCKIL
ncbi:hypothetical protein [Beduinella massiliensis]|uniref:hypothetical protein n=1 Tax=Beduinella massiliensis TaxID=1852363 RepID=UPI000C833F2A